jgi:hypothetical protein
MQGNEKRQSNFEAALKYAKAGWPVLPLHSTMADGSCTCRSKSCSKGKHPRTKNGIKDATKEAEQIRAWWTRWPDANIGVVTGRASGLVVLDIDIKNGKKGNLSLQALIDEHGPLPETLKAVTASGGEHYVFRFTRSLASRINVKDGIDLLADDKYFVVAPSAIADNAYQWVNEAKPAPCPDWVMQLGKEVLTTEDRLSTIIKELLPFGKERNGNWRDRCPFPPHEDKTPSFDVRLSDGVFHCLGCKKKGRIEDLYAHIKNVTKEEARRLIYPPPAYIEEMNRNHAVITDLSGKCVILNESEDPIHKWQKFTLSSLADLRGRYYSKQVFMGSKPILLADAWFRHPDRREYREFVFAPGKAAPPGYYNLWQGFPLTARPGDCTLYLRLIYEDICCKNTELNEYVLNWMALTVQRPWQRPEVALVLRGNEGVGKGIFCSNFGSLFGKHFKPLNSTRQLVGNFNAHLANALVVFADEALWAGDKPNEGVLKALITEKTMPLEYKGKDIVLIENHIHLIISTNNEWAVPAGPRARRFCVIDVSEEHMQKEEYFGPIDQEMNNGGREALFHMLLHRNIENFSSRKVPVTDALNEMKRRTIAGTPFEFWESILERGTLDLGDREWRCRVAKEKIHQQYSDWAKDQSSRKSTQTQLGMALKKICPHVKDCWIHDATDRSPKRGWDFGDLKACRDVFCKFFGWPNHDWGDEQRPGSVASAPIMDFIEGIRSVDTSCSDPSSPKAHFEEYDNFDKFREKGDDNLGPPLIEG